jgi:hypothetical protein
MDQKSSLNTSGEGAATLQINWIHRAGVRWCDDNAEDLERACRCEVIQEVMLWNKALSWLKISQHLKGPKDDERLLIIDVCLSCFPTPIFNLGFHSSLCGRLSECSRNSSSPSR